MGDLIYEKRLALKAQADVLVIGGGPSGVAAAVAAARSGANVMLLEQSGALGGMSAIAGVPELMNFDDGKNFIAKGFGEIIHRRLFGECAYERKWNLVRTEELKLLYDELVLESGVNLRFYTRVVDVVTREGRVDFVVVSAPEGMYAISARVIVDCTGSASACAAAGADFEYGDESGATMPGTLCSLWGGVDFSKKGRDADHFERAFADGVFSKYDTCLPGIKPTYPEVGVGTGNIGHAFGVNDCDGESMTRAMLECRRDLEEYRVFYKNYVPGCKNAVLMDTANFLGIRESRRVACETTLTADRFYDQTVRDDEIGRYSYPIDIHPMTPDKEGMADFDKAVSCRHGDGESYGIPYGALVPKGIDNMLVAGRCIGTDRAMQASVRVIPGCYITGQAAGVAAAISAREGVAAREVSPERIRATLKQIYPAE